MTITTVKVSEKGQIAIPQEIRKKIGIEKGDNLIMIEKGKKLFLEKTENAEEKLEDDFKDVLKYSEKSLKEIWENEEDDIWSEYLK